MTFFNHEIVVKTIDEMIVNRTKESIRIFTNEPYILNSKNDWLVISNRIHNNDEPNILLLGYADEHFRRCDECKQGVWHSEYPISVENDDKIMAIYGYGNVVCSYCIKTKNLKFNIF